MKYQLGASFFSILTSKLLEGLGSKIELIRFFASLRKMNFNKIQSVTLEEWLKNRIHHRDVFDLLITLCRIVTYANDPEIQSASSNSIPTSNCNIWYSHISGSRLADTRKWVNIRSSKNKS